MRLVLLLLSLCCLASCITELLKEETPLDRSFFPTGLSQSPDGQYLFVPSSNFSLRFNHGAMLSIDLAKVDSDLAQGQTELDASIIKSAIKMPSFSTQPLMLNGDSLLVCLRAQSKLISIPFMNGDLFSRAQEIALAFPPYYLESYLKKDGGTVVFAAGLDSDSISIIDAPSLNIRESVSLGSLVVEESATGKKKNSGKLRIRGIKISSQPAPLPPLLFVGCEFFPADSLHAINARSSRLVWMPIKEDGSLDLSQMKQVEFLKKPMGREIHGFDFWTADQEVFVLLHRPDSLVRFNFKDEVLMGVNATCEYPIDIKVSDKLVYVACFAEAVTAYDRFSLAEQHLNRHFGRGPIKLLFDNRPNIDRLYVSYFGDSSIGIFTPQLEPIGRLFKALPENMDGVI